ncbi:MAG: hypothetical protein HQK76_08985 [Desulfobacterales bacterium]|nr:hypothetical protein [Desulfobacterales bacterium]
METFTEVKNFVEDNSFDENRRKYLNEIDIYSIDKPILDLIKGFSNLPYCFTLQSCYGHFLHKYQSNPNDTEPLAMSNKIVDVDYRIAYIAICIENNYLGRELYDELKKIPEFEPDYIQFGCADFFWNEIVNSYVLQVEPKKFMTKDIISIDYNESLHLETVRNQFFTKLEKLIQKRV